MKIMQQCSLLLRKNKKLPLIFHKILYLFFDMYKNETQIIANLLNDPDNKTSKFATRKWYIINDQNNGQYGKGDEDNDSTIKFETKVIKPFLCDYSEAYILLTGDIKVTCINADTNVVFKNCAPFTRCSTHISEEHFETAKNLDIVMSIFS